MSSLFYISGIGEGDFLSKTVQHSNCRYVVVRFSFVKECFQALLVAEATLQRPEASACKLLFNCTLSSVRICIYPHSISI